MRVLVPTYIPRERSCRNLLQFSKKHIKHAQLGPPWFLILATSIYFICIRMVFGRAFSCVADTAFFIWRLFFFILELIFQYISTYLFCKYQSEVLFLYITLLKYHWSLCNCCRILHTRTYVQFVLLGKIQYLLTYFLLLHIKKKRVE